MQKIIAMTFGVLLSAGTVSAFADKQDQENLAQCKADIETYYGDNVRTRLRSIKHNGNESQMRLMVNPKGGSNTVVVCAVSDAGISRLENGDGIALVSENTTQTVTLAQ